MFVNNNKNNLYALVEKFRDNSVQYKGTLIIVKNLLQVLEHYVSIYRNNTFRYKF